MTDPAYRKPTWDELSKQRWGPSLEHDLPPIVIDAPRREAVSNTGANTAREVINERTSDRLL